MPVLLSYMQHSSPVPSALDQLVQVPGGESRGGVRGEGGRRRGGGQGERGGGGECVRKE